jgi:hypothetical protein
VKRRKPNKWFKRGTLYRRALDVLRTATGPITASEIAAAILKAEGIEDASKADVQSVSHGIQHSLKTMRVKAFTSSARRARRDGKCKRPPTKVA